MMTSLKKGESCKQKFKELRIFTVTSLYVLEVLCYMKKYKGSILEKSEMHDHNTRRKKDLHMELCRTSSLQKSVINTGIKLFNHLPSELKQLHDFKPFRKKLKFLLLNKALYTLNEYFDISIDKYMVEVKGFLSPIGVLCVSYMLVSLKYVDNSPKTS